MDSDQINTGAGNDMVTIIGGAADVLVSGATGNNVFAYTATGESATTVANTAETAASMDSITDFKLVTDVVAFAGSLGVNNFGGQKTTFANASFAANSVSVVTLDGTTVADTSKGATAADNNAALLVFNGTNSAIVSGTTNAITAPGLGTNAGLQVIGIAGVNGVNYGTIGAANFNFAFV